MLLLRTPQAEDQPCLEPEVRSFLLAAVAVVASRSIKLHSPNKVRPQPPTPPIKNRHRSPVWLGARPARTSRTYLSPLGSIPTPTRRERCRCPNSLSSLPACRRSLHGSCARLLWYCLPDHATVLAVVLEQIPSLVLVPHRASSLPC